MENKMYEVYTVTDENGNYLYIGQGLEDRHLHCTSGVSHVYDLNRKHFLKEPLNVHVVHRNITEEESLSIEKEMIRDLSPLFNKRGYNFHYLTKELWEIDNGEKTEESLERKRVILTLDQELYTLYTELGIAAIKATNFHKSKSKEKLLKLRGEHPVTLDKLEALKTIKLKQNNFYSFKELKDLVKCAYDKLSVKCTAKATDVQSVYSVKSTSRNGVRGYLIVGKI